MRTKRTGHTNKHARTFTAPSEDTPANRKEPVHPVIEAWKKYIYIIINRCACLFLFDRVCCGGGDGTQAAMCKMTFIQVTIVDKRINNSFPIQDEQEMEIQAR